MLLSEQGRVYEHHPIPLPNWNQLVIAQEREVTGEMGAGDRVGGSPQAPPPWVEWATGYKPHPEISPVWNLAFGEWVEIVMRQTDNGMSDTGNFYQKQPGRRSI